MRSIRDALLAGLLAAVILAGSLVAFGVYRLAYSETNELFDYQLQQMGIALRDRIFADNGGALIDEGDEFLIQVWDTAGAVVFVSSARFSAPVLAPVGLSTVAADGGDWRVYRIDAARQTVQVAQLMSLRRERAAAVALRMLAPLLVIVPALGIMVWIVVGRGLAPLTELARSVERRGPRALAPLPETELPTELRPLVTSLNDLLGRLGHALDRDRTFIADAAHELRSPLTAIGLQLQVLDRTPDGAERTQALDRLKAGVQRSTRLAQQLLDLARQDRTLAAPPPARVDLTVIAREVVAERAALAETREIELGLDAEEAHIDGDAESLRVLLGNLVENAIRYTPPGGTVDVRIRTEDSVAIAEVLDTGPGIPPQERTRVFDRFYRGAATDASGSGLGLAIVREIAARHDANVELHDRDNGPGLCARVRFKRAPQ